jgi:hypothetical protein
MKLLINLISIIAILCASVKSCPDEVGCLECSVPDKDNKRLCSYCENSFLDSALGLCTVKVSTPIEFCKKYNDADHTKCTFCEVGYYFDDKNVCSPCPFENCATCNKDFCIACKNKMTVDQTKKICLDVKCTIDNCNICNLGPSNTEICQVCDSAFSLHRDSVKCISGIPNCAEIAKADDKTCTKCQFGFFITNEGACKENSPSSSHMWMLWVFLGVVLLGLAGYFGYQKFAKQDDSRDVYLNA